jgi:2-polyprenyl-3-methyl-5-hydroxy-6-metoxy-1,4-benzoquinol methylase
VNDVAVICPGCGADNTSRLGNIAPSNLFAGRQLEQVLPGGSLWACPSCHLLFRYPRPEVETLKTLYQSGAAENWPTPVDQRTDWCLVRNWIKSKQGISRVLDVGCFDGRLLEYLGRDYVWLGVEMHEEAARRARERGVNLVSADFNQQQAPTVDADVALAIDVIEHSADPQKFLADIASCVRPGGYVVITTGNTNAPSWRLMGSRYWYCYIAEHLSFISPVWAKTAAARLDLDIEFLRTFSHAEGTITLLRKIYEAVANLLLRFAPALFAWLRKHGGGGIDVTRFPELALAPPYWMSAQDHMLIVFRKRQ